MKKLFLICCLAATMLAFDSCKKDPVIIDDSGNGSNNALLPVASFTYTTQQINGGVAIICQNTSLYADSYEWKIWNDNYEEHSFIKKPTFYVYGTGTYNIALAAENEYGIGVAKKTVIIKPKPTEFRISSFKLIKIPMLDNNNNNWDTGLETPAEPDIYFKILDREGNTTYYSNRGDVFMNVETLPITWTAPVDFTMTIGTEYLIRFMDLDTFGDETMATCIWSVNSESAGAAEYIWVSSNGKIKFSTGLTWIYPSKDEEQFFCVEECSNEDIVTD